MRGSVAALVAVAAWLTALGGEARAAADDEEALIRRGVELRKRGDDRAALQELQRAYQVAKSPRAAAQLGFAEQALAMWPQAETHVSESLRARDDPWIHEEPHRHRGGAADDPGARRAHRDRQAAGREPSSPSTDSASARCRCRTRSRSAGARRCRSQGGGVSAGGQDGARGAGEFARVSFALVAAGSADDAAARPHRGAPCAPVPAVAAAPVADTGAGADAGRERRVRRSVSARRASQPSAPASRAA